MKVEIITFEADPDRGGFGTRVHALIRMFSQFATLRVVRTDWFQGPQVPGVEYVDEPVSDTLSSKLRRLRSYYKTDFPRRDVKDPPDLVVVESLDLLGMDQYGGAVPLVLDEHNVYWNLLRYDMTTSPFFQTRWGRIRAVQALLTPYLLTRAKAFELRAVRQAAQTLVTSESDRGILLSAAPEFRDRIHVLPNCVDLDRIPYTPEGDLGTDILFVGNFKYTPNREAALYVSQVLALRLPDARFVLVGSSPPSEVRGSPNVRAPGFVEDLRPLLSQARVCIAPLFQGSGTRLKILTYLAAGRAVVATRKACEGLGVEDGVHLLLREDPQRFTEAVRELLTDEGLCRRLGDEGRRFVETRYDWRVHVPWLKRFSEQVQASR